MTKWRVIRICETDSVDLLRTEAHKKAKEFQAKHDEGMKDFMNKDRKCCIYRVVKNDKKI